VSTTIIATSMRTLAAVTGPLHLSTVPAACLSTIPFLLAAAAGFPAVPVIGAAAFEQLSASPIRADREPLGIEVDRSGKVVG